MGQLVLQDKAIPVEILLAVLEVVDGRVKDAESQTQRAWWVSVGAYLTVGFCCSLRGPEGFMLDLGALRKYQEQGRNGSNGRFVIVPLLGRFKGEDHHRQHLLATASETASGLQPRKWLEALVLVREQDGLTTGPAFCDKEGFVVAQSVMNSAFISCVEAAAEIAPDLFPVDLGPGDFDINRSLRRGSDTRAKVVGVHEPDINQMNRWRKWERAKGKRPAQSMSDRYSDVALLIPSFLRYTQPL
jgi:hypothetical protein